MKASKQLAIGMLFGVLCIGAMAAVNGVFNNITANGFINSAVGYKIAGNGGTSGQSLCSDGTYFDTPCSPAAFQVLGSVEFTSCMLADDGNGNWSCGTTAGSTATASWPASLGTTSYKMSCMMKNPGGVFDPSNVGNVYIVWRTKTATDFTYMIVSHTSGANGAQFTVDCIATT